MRVAALALSIALLGASQPAAAEAPTKAPPAWPESWVAPFGGQRPAARGSEYLFDAEGRRVAVEPRETPRPVQEEPAAAEPRDPRRLPRALMISGASLIASAIVAGLFAGVRLDAPEVATIALGSLGTLGLAGLSAGVILERESSPERSPRPRGAELTLTLSLR